MISGKHHPPSLSRQSLVAWLKSFLPEVSSKLGVEELGGGSLYCLILNHFYPGTIPVCRVLLAPKNEYQNSINLRLFQNGLTQHKINVYFDMAKVSKKRFTQNWNLICSIYRTFNEESQAPNVTLAPFKRPLESTPDLTGQLGASRIKTLNEKHSLGKMFMSREMVASPAKGKWSVNSHIFQSNVIPIVDWIKEILLKPSHDIEKIRQVKMLLGIPLLETAVKIQEEETEAQIIFYSDVGPLGR